MLDKKEKDTFLLVVIQGRFENVFVKVGKNTSVIQATSYIGKIIPSSPKESRTYDLPHTVGRSTTELQETRRSLDNITRVKM